MSQELYGKRIRSLRNEKGYTQQQLAKKAGIGLNTLRRYETDERQPNLDKLNKIVDALEISMNDFMFQGILLDEIEITDEYYEHQAQKERKEISLKLEKLNYNGVKRANENITDLLKIDEYTKPDNED